MGQLVIGCFTESAALREARKSPKPLVYWPLAGQLVTLILVWLNCLYKYPHASFAHYIRKGQGYRRSQRRPFWCPVE